MYRVLKIHYEDGHRRGIKPTTDVIQVIILLVSYWTEQTTMTSGEPSDIESCSNCNIISELS